MTLAPLNTRSLTGINTMPPAALTSRCGDALAAGTYELTFLIADYFAGAGVPQGAPPFVDRVPIRLTIADPHTNYHVPLLVTQWSYSTYQGS